MTLVSDCVVVLVMQGGGGVDGGEVRKGIRIDE